MLENDENMKKNLEQVMREKKHDLSQKDMGLSIEFEDKA